MPAAVMPAVSLVAVPGRRQRTLELAQEIERRGFPGIYSPSLAGDPVTLCLAIAQVTSTIEVGTSIEPIYLRHAHDLAAAASFVHEVSGGRFRLGLGVSHAPVHRHLQVQTGKPLSDVRRYVEELRSAGAGELPPVVLATLRDRMLATAVEVAEGAVWANASRGYTPTQLATVPRERLDGGFFVGNMIPITIDDDRAAAAAVNRKTLTGYVALPNYRNYWKAAGYQEEMEAVEAALDAGERDRVPGLMSDRWLSDVSLYGSVGDVREGLEAWVEAGVRTPIVVPSSTGGGQLKALEELFAAFS